MRNQNVGKKYQKEKCNENTVDGLAKKAETGAEQQNQEHGQGVAGTEDGAVAEEIAGARAEAGSGAW